LSRSLLVAAVLSAAALASVPARSASYSFLCQTGCNELLQGSLENPATGLSMAVTDGVTGALFTFANSYPVGSPSPSVGGIYFDQGLLSLFSGIGIDSQGGATFGVGGAPPVLPGGDALAPPFSVSFFATATGAPGNGLDAVSDYVSVLATFTGGATFGQVVSALNSGGLRVGLHVTPGGTYVNAIPEPGTWAMVLAGLLAVGVVARRRMRVG
jgi:hypothetical protein